MASFDSANAVDTTDAGDFIPEVWSLEILAAYRKNLVMADVVTILNHQGKKGDNINIPTPTRGAATAKSAATPVALIAFTDTNTQISLNQHAHYSRLVEDITELQALASLRGFFTRDAGYALAKFTDDVLHDLAATWNSGTAYSGAVIGSDGSTAYDSSASLGVGNGAALADAGIRRVIQTLDDSDVPATDRVLVVPPVSKNSLLAAVDGSNRRLISHGYTGEAGSSNSYRNGLVGDVYGVEVFVSSNCESIVAGDTSTPYRVALMFQKEAVVLAEQMRPRVRQQPKLEHLGTLIVADSIFGAKTVRAEGARAIIVPA